MPLFVDIKGQISHEAADYVYETRGILSSQLKCKIEFLGLS